MQSKNSQSSGSGIVPWRKVYSWQELARTERWARTSYQCSAIRERDMGSCLRCRTFCPKPGHWGRKRPESESGWAYPQPRSASCLPAIEKKSIKIYHGSYLDDYSSFRSIQRNCLLEALGSGMKASCLARTASVIRMSRYLSTTKNSQTQE